MSYEQLEILVKALGVLVGLIITLVIKPYIDSKVSATEQAKVENYIKIAVRCAEQIYTVDQWKEKKEYVLNYTLDLINDCNLVDVKLTTADIENLIEGMVYAVKKEGK